MSIKGIDSPVSRFYLLLPAFNMIFSNKTHLLWGYGVSNGLIEYRKRLDEFNPNEFRINDPHNSYVTLLIMLGAIITLIVLLFVFILIVKGIRRTLSNTFSNHTLVYIFLISSTLSIMIQGLFDTELIKIECFTIHYLSIMIGLMFYLFTDKKTKIQDNILELTR